MAESPLRTSLSKTAQVQKEQVLRLAKTTPQHLDFSVDKPAAISFH